MATSAPPQAAAHAESAKKSKGGKKKLIVMALLAVLLLGGGGGGAFWMMSKKKAEEAAAADSEDGGKAEKGEKGSKKSAKGDKKKDKENKPVFVEADPFTVNLADTDEQRMAQLKLTLSLDDEKEVEEVKNMMPVVRNNILLLLSSKSAADLGSRQGKEKLAGEVVAAANQALEGTAAADGVKAILFQQIIVQ